MPTTAHSDDHARKIKPPRRSHAENQLSSYRVRTAVAADADKLADLNAVVQALHHREHPKLFKAPDLDASMSQFLVLLAQPEVTVLLAEVWDGRPTGYSYVELFDRPETAFTHAHSHLVRSPSVRRERAQGSGVGCALLDAVKALARRTGVQRLTGVDRRRQANDRSSPTARRSIRSREDGLARSQQRRSCRCQESTKHAG